MVIISTYDVNTVFDFIAHREDFVLRHSGAPWRWSPKPLSLEVTSELDKLQEGRACVGVAPAPPPGTICGTQQCSIPSAPASTHYVLCLVQNEISKMWCLCTPLKRCLLIKMTASSSGMRATSGWMRKKLESPLSCVPNLQRKKSLNLSQTQVFFPAVK